MRRYLLANRKDTGAWGEALGRRLRSGDVIALTGDLGAGKTTLTQAIARGLGITSPVTSPTFALIHEYNGPKLLLHLDPYRLERPEDVADLGLDEYIGRGGIMVIEWADKIAALLPEDRLNLTLEIMGEAGEEDDEALRFITVSAGGTRSQELLAECAGLPEWSEREENEKLS